MLVFTGGLTLEQVEKMKNGDPIIFHKVPYKEALCKSKNTFDYVPKSLYNAPLHIFRRYISEDCYSKQYLFFARNLVTTLQFCHNGKKKNYIMVCDIEEELLNHYIGVGDYCDCDYRIEYRLPRVFITPDRIKDFLFFEPYDEDQMMELKEKYKDYFMVKPTENEEARKLILTKKLEFNGRRNWK